MKVWFITGTSSGFGQAWAEAALERGDHVAATALDTSRLEPLVEKYGDRVLSLELDVTDQDGVRRCVAEAHQHFGRLDVVINNAGYGHLGMIEEFTSDEARNQLETNFFGTLWVTQACAPILRAQGSGSILQVSSMGGIAAYPLFGMYNASKWAVEGLSQALASELRPFGVNVTIVEPIGYATDWWGPGLRHTTALADYAEQSRTIEAGWAASAADRGDPRASADAIFAVVDAHTPPLRILLGDGGHERVEAEYRSRLDVWQAWKEVSTAAHGRSRRPVG